MKKFNSENLLNKYGWKKGDGLGKNENGIKEAIKVDIKKDVHGVGFDVGKEYKNHWWENLFNETAKQIIVADDKISVKLKKKKKKTKKVLIDEQYSSFVKSSNESDSHLIENDSFNPIYKDNELFNKLNGLTAHKGARHGLRLDGKLKRIAAQEEEQKTEKIVSFKKKK